MSSICGLKFGRVQAQGINPCYHPSLSTRTQPLPFKAFPSFPKGLLRCSMLNWFHRRMAVLQSRCRVIANELLAMTGLLAPRFASILTEGAAAVQHVKLVPPQNGSSAVPLPCDCQQIIGARGFAGSSVFIRHYVDEQVLVEECFLFRRMAVFCVCCSEQFPVIFAGWVVGVPMTRNSCQRNISPTSKRGWRCWVGFSTRS